MLKIKRVKISKTFKTKPLIGIIGGSGLYNLDGLKKLKYKKILTPYGSPSDKLLEAQYKDIKIIFLPRHGSKHTIPPHNINYKANIFSLKKMGVTDIISISAVGSLKKIHKPGDFLLVDQFIDRTFNRATTFFDHGCVAHVSLAKPVSEQLSELIYKASTKSLRLKNKGTYIAIEGPQFSTYSESMLYKSWNCDVIGMTNLPEARLAREAEMGYSSIAMVTDYDCWHQDHAAVTVDQVLNTMHNNISKAKILLKSIFDTLHVLKKWNFKDKIYFNLDDAVLTKKEDVDKKTLKRLTPILKRRFCL